MQFFGGRRGGLLLAAVAAVGILIIVLGVKGQDPDPEPPPKDVGSLDLTPSPSKAPSKAKPPSDDTSSPGTVEKSKAPPLGPSTPVSISVPKIDVDSEVITLGTSDDGTLEVPQPGPDLDKAAWFDKSPTPGQPGPSIIEGHVSTKEGGPSIFFELGKLRPGDEITVRRKDGTAATFKVYAVRTFAKDAFPTKLVYGGDLSTPTLRLITCSNFDASIGHHTGNLVVFSKLTEVRDT